MPGFVIHLAIAQQYAKINSIKNEELIKGVIMPDLLDKKISHYGETTAHPNFEKYFSENNIETDYDKGYLLHLVTDYLFYNKLLKGFTGKLYDDYDRLNDFLVEKYKINMPEEVLDVVKSSKEEPQILKREMICDFIEKMSKIDLEKCKDVHGYLENYI